MHPSGSLCERGRRDGSDSKREDKTVVDCFSYDEVVETLHMENVKLTRWSVDCH